MKVTCCPALGVGLFGEIVRAASVVAKLCAVDEPETPGPPKFHDHAVGPPVEASPNCTTSPTRTTLGSQVKAAVGADGRVQVFRTVTVVEPETDMPPAVPPPETV